MTEEQSLRLHIVRNNNLISSIKKTIDDLERQNNDLEARIALLAEKEHRDFNNKLLRVINEWEGNCYITKTEAAISLLYVKSLGFNQNTRSLEAVVDTLLLRQYDNTHQNDNEIKGSKRLSVVYRMYTLSEKLNQSYSTSDEQGLPILDTMISSGCKRISKVTFDNILNSYLVNIDTIENLTKIDQQHDNAK